MTKQRIYYNGAGGGQVLTVLAREAGRVKEAKLSITPSGPGQVAAELSFQGVSQLALNDSRNVLVRTPVTEATTGLGTSSQEFPVENVRIGDQMYLHTLAPGGGITMIVEGYIVIGK